MKLACFLLASLLPWVGFARDQPPAAVALGNKMDEAWGVTWSRFFQKDVQTFMDYLSSYEPGKELAHLPTAEEVGRQYPNPCGYGSGMEDGMILGGAMLSLLCDRFALTGEESLRRDSAEVFSGMRRAATVHGVPGFVARNVCVEDKKSVYINSSRDQYTHFVHGLWQYYHSPLADAAARAEVSRLLAAVADRMIAYVVPANDYDSSRADGTRDPLGISRMWNVQPHESARLPMIYAAAWDVTRDERYRERWRHYISDAVSQSTGSVDTRPTYALLQMQASLELLRHLEPDTKLKATLAETMQRVSELGWRRFTATAKRFAQKTPEQMRVLGPDWRHVKEWKDQKGYLNPQWGQYREIWYLTREAGEAALIPLMNAAPDLSSAQTEAVQDVLLRTDYLQNSSCGIVFHLAAYWKARRAGRF